MKRMSLLALIVLVSLVLSGCGGGVEGASVESPTEEGQQQLTGPSIKLPAEEELQPAPVEEEVVQSDENMPLQSEEMAFSADYNLELWAEPYFTPLGEGITRAAYLLTGKNASTGWYGYRIGDSSVTDCFWMRDALPSLFTEEGYLYPALGFYDFYPDTVSCGYRNVWYYNNPLPPGTVFSLVSLGLEEPLAFGIVMFDIPETATPKSLQVPNDPVCQHPKTCMVKTAEAHFGSYEGPVPIDMSYGARIYQAGEGIDIGEVARLIVTSGDSGDFIRPVFTIESLHSGYILKITMLNFGFLHQNPALVSFAGYRWPNTERFTVGKVGPMQTTELVAEMNLGGKYWPTPNGETYWLFGHIELEEDSPRALVTGANFLVELP